MTETFHLPSPIFLQGLQVRSIIQPRIDRFRSNFVPSLQTWLHVFKSRVNVTAWRNVRYKYQKIVTCHERIYWL